MAHSKASGSYYALTAIGVGLLVLGVVMAVWNLVPGFGSNENPGSPPGNSSKPETHGEINLKSKTFTVAYVLVGSGISLLLLAICLSIRSKQKRRPSMDNVHVVPQEVTVPRGNDVSHEERNSPGYSAPSYEEVMRLEYEPRQTADADRDQRMSITLPSYESLNELDDSMPTRPNAAKPERTNSRSGKEKKPLNIRRIKSDKLHLKEFRLNLAGRSNLAETQKIEPITPPPQYDDKQIGDHQPI
ncbi:transmembrane protein 51-like isoform X2 [Rana temporaria]|uniref:transmembrane protein 51-like isoform X2 n=1 Tax=Rana temporaria TaxID=8407 RepID=UPI001AAD533B|nr:transmembrane protein 51-like isoform X2 [Rana temporaria]